MFRALQCPSSGARQTAVAASGFRMNVEVEVFSAVAGLLKKIKLNLKKYIHNRLEIAVCSCTDGSRNSQSFLLLCAVCSSYAFLRLDLSLLRCRRTAIETITADMVQTVWDELDYRVDVCRITKSAHIEHL